MRLCVSAYLKGKWWEWWVKGINTQHNVEARYTEAGRHLKVVGGLKFETPVKTEPLFLEMFWRVLKKTPPK